MMDESVRKALWSNTQECPYSSKLGLRVIEIDKGYSRMEMDVHPDLFNIYGTLHGGAIFSLIDEAFQAASNAHGTTAVALNMTISYLAAPKSESRLTAEARELHLTRRTGHYEIKVTDDQGRLIATCQALAYRKGQPLPFL